MKVKTLELIFATQNENKAREIQNLLPENVVVKTLREINCFDDIPEEQKTLEGNALQKARYVYQKFGVNCFADDTGLEIVALDGAPGVYSARYAGEEKDDDKNMDLVLRNLENLENRKAQFRTVIALILNGEEHLFEGLVEGKIRKEKTGSEGFGYDPIFEPEECGKTFAEMDLVEKNTKSHRGRAIKGLSSFLKEMKLNRKSL